MKLNKNGIITSLNFNESDAMKMNTVMSGSYTPIKDKLNSTITLESIKGFETGKKYYVEMTLSWSGFIENANANFGSWFQGATFDGESWLWDKGNPIIATLNQAATGSYKIDSLLLNNTSGHKFLCGFFTANERTGYQVGCRTDYSNGIGRLTFSGLKIIPVEYAVTPPRENLEISALHIGENYLSTGDFMEY